MLGHGGRYIRPLDLHEHLLELIISSGLFSPYPLIESFFVPKSEISLDFSSPIAFRRSAGLLSPLGRKWTLLSLSLWSVFGFPRAGRRHLGRLYDWLPWQ